MNKFRTQLVKFKKGDFVRHAHDGRIFVVKGPSQWHGYVEVRAARGESFVGTYEIFGGNLTNLSPLEQLAMCSDD